MASPVDTSVKFFRSDMAGAPGLSGTAGAMIALLDACLKDGFDTKTLTSLVAAAGVMTATFTGVHSAAQDAVVLIAGVTGGPTGFADANGEQKVVARPSATTATWATALPDGTYTGTITMKMAPAGWSKTHTGTNKAAYKSNDVAASNCLLRVDDSAAQVVRVVGYESMTDIDTGVNPFPSNVQMSGGGYWPKSSAANATNNEWALFADSRFFLLFIAPGKGANVLSLGGTIRGFGDMIPYRPGGDPYACGLSYSVNSSVSAMSDGSFDVANAAQVGVPRTFAGLGSSQLHIPVPYVGGTAVNSGLDTWLGTFPSAIDGGLRLTRRYISLGAGSPPRAEIPGLLTVPQSALFDSFKTFDTVVGTGIVAGRKLMAVSPTSQLASPSNNGNTGAAFVDVTGPWR